VTGSPAALLAPTPVAWLDAASVHWQELLIDHASCEKKAASTALALVFAYPEQVRLNLGLARLAREELRHFEQVTRLMQKLGVPFRRLKPGRYAARLRAALRTHEPARQLDLLICGAIIEARSCERFGLLVPRLPAPIAEFYADLERAEALHVDLYWEFALEAAGAAGEAACQARLAELVEVEAGLVTSGDTQLRFHSGPPAPGALLPG